MIAIILGTRPEIIKMSPVIRNCIKKNLDFYILHTGQHYTFEMDRAFFNDLQLPSPKYNLDVGSGMHGVQTGKILMGIESVLMKEKPDIVLVQGDTNTVLAGALAATKLHLRIGHVEAGLRSFDRTMPEEINRTLTDHASDLLFAPTETAKQNLLREGIPKEQICVTGNTVADAIFQNRGLAKRYENELMQYGFSKGNYFLATVHRAENVDSKVRLGNILSGLAAVQHEHDMPVLFPVHPRTKKMIELFAIKTDRIIFTRPLGYFEFLALESNARLIFTDSGGVQEETCILGVPCITLRDNTERPETISIGANTLAGTDRDSILAASRMMMQNNRSWIQPYGDGTAGERIIHAVSVMGD